MGLGRFARLGGAGIRGFYEGRDMMRDAQERDEDYDWTRARRRRQVEEEAYYDPINRERAGIGLETAQRENEYGEFADPLRRNSAERADTIQGIDTEDYVDQRGMRQRAAQRADEAGDMDMDDRRFRQPYDRAGIRRHDQIDQMDTEDYTANRGFRQRAAERQDTLGRYATEEAGRQNTYGAEYQHSFMQQRESEDYLRNANNAIGNFAQTGNPAALEDFYNNMYPDDGQVTIEKLPDGRYKGTFSSGQTSIKTKEELLAGSKEFFMAHPLASQQGMGLQTGAGGFGGVMGTGIGAGRGRGGYGGYGGYGSTSGKTSAYTEKVYGLADSLLRSGRASNPTEALMMAHDQASQKAGKSPEERFADFYETILEQFLPSADEMQMYRSDPAALQEAIRGAEEQAMAVTQRYRERYLGGYNGSNSGGQTGDGSMSGSQVQIPQEAIDELMASRNDPSAKEEFDQVFGPGAAEAVLNGKFQ